MNLQSAKNIQSTLDNISISKPFSGILNRFIDCYGVRLDTEIKNRLDNASIQNPLVVVDACCGYGTAAETLAGFPELLYLSPEKFEPEFYKKLSVVGTDLKPHPDKIDECEIDLIKLARGGIFSKYLLEKEPSFLNGNSLKNKNEFSNLVDMYLKNLPEKYAKFVSADVSALPYKNDSADIIYSMAGLQYVTDSIKALEEIYRVLKPGGFAAVHITTGKRGISNNLSWDAILENTPGAESVFEFKPTTYDFFKRSEMAGKPVYYPESGVVIIKKSQDDNFNGKFRVNFKNAVFNFSNPVCPWEHLFVSANYELT